MSEPNLAAPVPAGPWPVAGLDPVARLRVLAGALDGCVLTERVVEATVDDLWSYLADLEHIGSFDQFVGRVRIRDRRPSADDPAVEELAITAHVPAWGPGLPMAVRLEPGLCLMHGWRRLYFVGMAVADVGDGVHVRHAHLEGVPLPGARLLRPLLRRHVARDVAGIDRERRGPS